MTSRVDALEEVTLAIAVATARHDADFAERLGAQLRSSLQRNAPHPAVFRETFEWLLRFEDYAGEHSGPSASHEPAEDIPMTEHDT